MKKHLTLLLIFGLSLSASAQSGSEKKREITLDEAIRIALDKNYSTRSASLELQRSELERTKTKDALLPGFSGDASYRYSQQITKSNVFGYDADSNFTVIGTTTPDQSQSVSYGLSGDINIYAGGGDAARIEASSSSLDASKYSLKWTRQSVALDVTRAYINALRTRELVTTSEKSVEQINAQLERVRGLYQAGSVPIGQVYQQEAQLGQQELELITSRNDYDNAKADLLYLLNIPATSYDRHDVTTSSIDTSIRTLKAKSTSIAPQEGEIERVIASREDFAALRSAILANEASLGITRSALLPRIDANVGIGGSGVRADLERMRFFNSYYGGLNVSVPIFDRMQNRIQIEQQEIDIESSKIRLEQTEQQYRAEIAKAINTLKNAELAIDAAQRLLRSAEESLRSAQERYRVGAGTQTDVIIAQTTLQQARTSNVNAIYTLLLAQKVLEYQLGRWNY